MKLPTETLSQPRNRFPDSDKVRVIQFRDGDHTPDNKRAGTVKSVLNFDIQRHQQAGWVQFSMTEITTAIDSGRQQGRTITTVIPKEMVEAFASFILKGE